MVVVVVVVSVCLLPPVHRRGLFAEGEWSIWAATEDKAGALLCMVLARRVLNVLTAEEQAVPTTTSAPALAPAVESKQMPSKQSLAQTTLEVYLPPNGSSDTCYQLLRVMSEQGVFDTRDIVMLPALQPQIQALDAMHKNPCWLYWRPETAAASVSSNLPAVPAGYTIAPLQVPHAVLVNRQWKFASPTSLPMIEVAQRLVVVVASRLIVV